MKTLDNNTPHLLFIGDTHGDDSSIYRAAKAHPGVPIIHVGDFGVGFLPAHKETRRMDNIEKVMGERLTHLYIVRGNHDNPDFWTNNNDYENITFVPDHTSIEIGGKWCYIAGGGISIDRTGNHRIVGQTYWVNEVMTSPPYEKSQRIHDYLITHSGLPELHTKLSPTAYAGWVARDPALVADQDLERRILLTITEEVSFNTWICGHFHTSLTTKWDGSPMHFLGVEEVAMEVDGHIVRG